MLRLCLIVVLIAACSSSSSTSGPGANSTTTTSATTPRASDTSTPEADVTLAPPMVPKTGAYFGTWRGPGPGRPDNPKQNIRQAENSIGRKYAIDHRYYDWGAAVPTAYERWTASQGRIPMVSLCACRFGKGSVEKWSTIASGKDDAYLISVARRFVALRTPAFFVFDSEPETQVGTSGSAVDYVQAFRHVVAVFRTQKATNVAFVWATTSYAFQPDSGEAALVESFYPGDDVVDWIAADPYNFDTDGAWHSLPYEIGPWYAWATSTHEGKPLTLTEWGTKEDPIQPDRKANWFQGALSSLESQYRDIRAVVYFDERKVEHETVNDWRIDTSASSLAGFAQIAKTSWFDVGA